METNEFSVEYPSFASYPSIQEALAASSQDERLAKSKRDSLLIWNKAILDYRVSQHQAELMLSDNLLLTFTVVGDKVQWRIQEEAAFSAQMQSASPKKLIFHEAEDEPPFVWERDRFLQERVGRKVHGISVADIWTIFYTSGMKELMFHVVYVANSNDTILCFMPPS